MAAITVTNQKGGVGKTTTTLNLAAGLQERGVRVLAIDFDPQGSLTTACGIGEPMQLRPGQTIADALLTTVHYPVREPVTARDVIVSTPAGVDLVPSNQELAAAEKVLYSVYGREHALRDTLAPVRADYDVILIDSVPTLGLLAINSLAAVDGLIIPVQAEFLAVHGLAQLLESVAQVRERLNPGLQIWGVALTMVDGRTKHSREIVQGVRENLAGQVAVFRTEIPVDVKLKDSSRVGTSVLRYDSRSRAARAYRELAEEVARLVPAAKTLPFPAAALPAPAARPDENGAAAPRIQPSVEPSGSNGSNGAKPLPIVGPIKRQPLPIARTRLVGVCPYLGLLDDPTVHSPEVCHEHRCYATTPPLEILPRDQHLSCLTKQHSACVRYFRASASGLIPPSQRSAPQPSVLGRLRVFLGGRSE